MSEFLQNGDGTGATGLSMKEYIDTLIDPESLLDTRGGRDVGLAGYTNYLKDLRAGLAQAAGVSIEELHLLGQQPAETEI